MKIAILISGRGSNMAALIRQNAAEGHPMTVAFVASDRASAAGLQLASEAGLPVFLLPYSEGREAGEARLEELWQVHDLDLLVLAGFMRLLSPRFVKHHSDRILNIHPSLLPQFPGAHGIRDFWESGQRESGVTVHLVDQEMDHGPILLQQSLRREPQDSLESFEAKIHSLEHRLYWQALKAYAAKLGKL